MQKEAALVRKEAEVDALKAQLAQMASEKPQIAPGKREETRKSRQRVHCGVCFYLVRKTELPEHFFGYHPLWPKRGFTIEPDETWACTVLIWAAPGELLAPQGSISTGNWRFSSLRAFGPEDFLEEVEGKQSHPSVMAYLHWNFRALTGYASTGSTSSRIE